MGAYELTHKYGKRTVTSALNAAIRAEIPGGSEVLDLLSKTRAVAVSKSESSERFAEIFESLRKAQREMKNAIAKKYGLRFAKEI